MKAFLAKSQSSETIKKSFYILLHENLEVPYGNWHHKYCFKKVKEWGKITKLQSRIIIHNIPETHMNQ